MEYIDLFDWFYFSHALIEEFDLDRSFETGELHPWEITP